MFYGHRCVFEFRDLGCYLNDVSKPRRSFVMNIDMGYDKEIALIVQPGYINAVVRKELCPSPLHVAQIVGVIDNASGIGVFIIDFYFDFMRHAFTGKDKTLYAGRSRVSLCACGLKCAIIIFMGVEILKELLPQKLKDGLTPAEERLLETVQDGTFADFKIGKEEEDNPEKAETWGAERIIRSDFIYWLCTNAQAQPYIHAKGIRIAGAKIDGDIDFEFTTVSRSLSLEYCAIANINFMNADARDLSFTGSVIHALNAN